MIGTILHFDAGSDSGFIRAEDGSRYRFSAADWASPGAAIAGDVVDFEPADGIATEIFVTSRVAQNAEPDTPPQNFAAQIPETISAPQTPYTHPSGATGVLPSPVLATPITPPVVAMPSGLGARFFITYFIALIPTYILPYLGSNSMVANGLGAAAGGFPIQFWWHFSTYGILIFLAYIRGVRIARGWLVTFPILAMIFDLMPGLNFIPFVPSIFNFVVLYVGATRKAPDGYAPENLNQKIEYGLWGIAAFSAFAIYNIFRTPFSGSSGFAASLLLWPVFGLAVFFAIKYRAGEGAALFARLAPATDMSGDGIAHAPMSLAPDMIENAPAASAETVSASASAPASAFCHQCGTPNASDYRFCLECGAAA